MLAWLGYVATAFPICKTHQTIVTASLDLHLFADGAKIVRSPCPLVIQIESQVRSDLYKG